MGNLIIVFLMFQISLILSFLTPPPGRLTVSNCVHSGGGDAAGGRERMVEGKKALGSRWKEKKTGKRGPPLVSMGCHGNEPIQPVEVVMTACRIWKCDEGGSGIHQSNSCRKTQRGEIIALLFVCFPKCC